MDGLTQQIRMPNGDIIEAPKDMSDAEIKERVYASEYGEQIRQANLPEGIAEELGAGLLHGIETTGSLIGTAGPAFISGVMGDKEGYTEGLKQYQREGLASSIEHPGRVESFRDINGIADIPSYIARGMGELAPSIGVGVGAGAVANIAAKAGVKQLAKRAGSSLTDAAAQSVVRNATIAGTLTGAAIQEIPASYIGILSTSGINAPVTAVLAGALKSSLEILAPMKVLNDILGPKIASDAVSKAIFKKLGFKHVGKEAVKIAGTEGITEGAQEAIDILAENFVDENQEIFTIENMDRMIESTLKGAIGGGGVGIASGVVQVAAQGPVISEEQLKSKFKEEDIGEAKNKQETTNSIVATQEMPPIGAQLDLFNEKGKPVRYEVTPEVQQEVNATLKRATEATTMQETKVPAQAEMDLGAVDAQLKRKADIQAEKRADTEFVPGDGEMVTGASSNKMFQRAPVRQVTVDPLSAPSEEVKLQRILANGTRFEPVGETVEDTLIQSKVLENQLRVVELSSEGKAKHAKLGKQLANIVRSVGGKAIDFQGVDFLDSIETVQEGRAVLPLSPKEVKVFTEIFQPPQAEKGADRPVGRFKARTEIQQAVPSIQFDPKINSLTFRPEDSAAFLDYVQSKGIDAGTGASTTDLANKVGKALRNVQTLDVQQFSPVRGAQYRNSVYVALSLSSLTQGQTLDLDMLETAYHETWHTLEEQFKIFTPSEMKTLEAATVGLKDYIIKGLGVTPFDLETFYSSPRGRAEIRAWAFGMWVKGKVADGTLSIDGKILPPKGVPATIGRLYVKALNFLRKLNNSLRGNGFTSYEDLFIDVAGGGRAVEMVEESIATQREVRLQKISDDHQTAVAEKKFEEALHKDTFKEELQDAIKDTNKLKQLGLTADRIISNQHFARYDPYGAKIISVEARRQASSAERMTGYQAALDEYHKAPKAVRQQIHNLASYLRDTGQSAELDDQGRLTFDREGRRVRLNDVEIGKQYTALQQAYKSALGDYMDTLKQSARDEFPLPENFTFEDINTLVTRLEGEKGSTKKIERLVNLKGRMSELIGMMVGKDFVPHMRFGQWGITVRDKRTKEQVDFRTIEKGKFRKKYNKFQMQEMVDELQDLYGDTTKYEIIGGNGTIRNPNINNLVPFSVNKNAIGKEIDSSLVTMDMIASMLNSTDLDAKEYGELRDTLYNDILNKGFKKRFDKGKDIQGYSKDWDRVSHSYFSGAAHFLSGLEQAKDLSLLRAEIPKVDDAKRVAKYNRMMDYIGSPQNDWQSLRQVNFLWTMGGNLSTAALQLMTLPTLTLGSMTQYSMNVPNNMRLITKWMGVGTKEFVFGFGEGATVEDGNVIVGFNNRAKLQKLLDSGKITETEAHFMRKMSDMNKTSGLFVEENAGTSRYETRSKGGNLKDVRDRFINMAGAPISAMEQLTRFATSMATLNMLESSPRASARAKKILSSNPLFQAQLKANPDLSFNENVAAFSMDEVHAMFGKIGRPDVFKGMGGSLVLPFMTYPQQALELMIRMGGRGASGKAALATTLGSLWFFAGLMGIPGGELLKELFEEAYKATEGEELDLDYEIRRMVYDLTGNPTYGLMVTQGFGRAYGNLDVSRRIGLPIPGQDILMTIMGIRGDPSDLLGVQGSMLTGVAKFWQEYKLGGLSDKAGVHLMPVAAANLLKAEMMGKHGVSTARGKQLQHADDVTFGQQLLRGFGVGSGELANKREAVFYGQILERKDRPAYERFTERSKRAATKILNAKQSGDTRLAKEGLIEYEKVFQDMFTWSYKKGYTIDVSSFMNSVMAAAVDRSRVEQPVLQPLDLRKTARDDYDTLMTITKQRR